MSRRRLTCDALEVRAAAADVDAPTDCGGVCVQFGPVQPGPLPPPVFPPFDDGGDNPDGPTAIVPPTPQQPVPPLPDGVVAPPVFLPQSPY